MNLATSLESIKGIGSKTREQFHVAGLDTVRDLIYFFPRSYEDFSHIQTISQVTPGKVTVQATCERVEVRTVRRGMAITTATLVDNTGKLQAVWFNQPYRKTQLQPGSEFFFSGEYEFRYNRYQLTNPSVEKVSEMPVQTDRILPIYRSIKGLKPLLVRKIMNEVRPLFAFLPETLPADIIAKYELVSIGKALEYLHFPHSIDEVSQAKKRLGFEELFNLLLASQMNKQENSKLSGWSIPFSQTVVKAFVEQLPFALTNAQRLAAWDILQDFERAIPMNRLLQGDVGSGKTVVAGLAARQAAEAGFQSAIMAPTEILAAQHAQTLDSLLRPFDVTVGLLTGSVKGKAREALYDAIRSGKVDVVVGTHALIQEAVTFSKLGFVVIDEQHRFGVKQRQELLKKSEHMPHLLAMTATPIPRSLALTVYGEMDISILNERPKGRKPIKTAIWSPNSRARLYKEVEKELEAGRQAYVICSLIDSNPNNELKSVQKEYDRLRQGPFKHRSIGLLHGKLKPEEKEAVMQQFSRHEIDLLVSTTVVEVGVDVPNATVIIIEDADRFGLAQLHQLRGRVGRSEYQSYCYLVTSSSAAPSQRLKAIAKSNDGFYLAEVDMQLRGPGEIYGRAQHGALNLQIATLADTQLISLAQQASLHFIEEKYDLLKYKELAHQVKKYQRLTTLN